MSENKYITLGIVSSALFLITVDMTVLYTALPRLVHDLNASGSQKLWIINAYGLAVAGFLPGFGTLGDKLGHKLMFMLGLLVFAVASLAAAYSPTASFLVLTRSFLGLGAAMMMPATLSLIRTNFPDEKERAFAVGIWSSVSFGGMALGPLIGGILLEYFSWGSVFLINVPVVAVTFIAAVFILPANRVSMERQWDFVSSLQILIGLTALTASIKEASKGYSAWLSFVLLLFAGGLATFFFIRRQLRLEIPLINLSFFKNRSFTGGVLAAALSSVIMIGTTLVLTQYLQLIAGLSPLQAALYTLPLPLAAFAGGPLGAIILVRTDSGRFMSGTLLLMAASVLIMLFFRDLPLWQKTGMGFFGLFAGACMAAASNSIMSNAPEENAGMAASVEETSFELGGAIGVALFGSILAAVYSMSLALPPELQDLAGAGDSMDSALLIAEGLGAESAAKLVALAKIAFDKACAAAFLTASVISALTAGLIRKTG